MPANPPSPEAARRNVPGFLEERAAQASPLSRSPQKEFPIPPTTPPARQAEEARVVGAPRRVEKAKETPEEQALAQIQAVRTQVGTGGEPVKGNRPDQVARRRDAEGAIITAYRDEAAELTEELRDLEIAQRDLAFTKDKVTRLQGLVDEYKKKKGGVPPEELEELEHLRESLAAEENRVRGLSAENHDHPQELREIKKRIGVEKSEQARNAAQCQRLETYVRRYSEVTGLPSRERQKAMLERRVRGEDLEGVSAGVREDFENARKQAETFVPECGKDAEEALTAFLAGKLTLEQITGMTFTEIDEDDAARLVSKLSTLDTYRRLVIKQQQAKWGEALRRAEAEIAEISGLVPRAYTGKSKGAHAVATLTDEILKRFPPPQELAQTVAPREKINIKVEDFGSEDEAIAQPPVELGLDKLSGEQRNALRKQAIQVVDAVEYAISTGDPVTAEVARAWLTHSIQELRTALPGAGRNPDLLARQLVWFMGEDIAGSIDEEGIDSAVKQTTKCLVGWNDADKYLRRSVTYHLAQQGESFEPPVAAHQVEEHTEEDVLVFSAPEEAEARWQEIQRQAAQDKVFDRADLEELVDAIFNLGGRVVDDQRRAKELEQRVQVITGDMLKAGIPANEIKTLFDEAKARWMAAQTSRAVR